MRIKPATAAKVDEVQRLIRNCWRSNSSHDSPEFTSAEVMSLVMRIRQLEAKVRRLEKKRKTG